MPARMSLAVCCGLAALLLVPQPLEARQGSTASDREARTSPPPPRPADAGQDDDWWDPYVSRIRWLQDRGVHPEVGIITAGSGLSFGASYRKPRIGESRFGVEAGAMWSIRRYTQYRLRAGMVEGMHHTLELRPADARISSQFNDSESLAPGLAVYADVHRRGYPRVNFYGLGPDVGLDDRSDYGLEGYTADAVIQWQRDAHVGVAARVGVLDFGIGRGSNANVTDLQDAFDPAAIPGALEQTRFLTTGVAVVRDARDSPALTTSGTFAGVSLWRFTPVGSSDPGFTRVTLDARAFATPIDDRGVLAMRLLVATDLRQDGAAVPFYLEQHLGGSDTLRGYPSYVLRDAALAHVSIEYRWRAHRMLEVSPFVDAGVVGGGFGSLRRVRTTPGVGLRVRNDDRVLFRMDIAHRPGGVRLSFSMSPVF